MKPLFQQLLSLLRARDARLLGLSGGGALLTLALLYCLIRLRRPSSDELERRRCERLSSIGRITDGLLIRASHADEDSVEAAGLAPESPVPAVLVYSYRIAGVTYNCAQDVSRLQDRIPGFSFGQATAGQVVQVRYDPRNPGNSIVLSESWTGLWTTNREEAQR